MCISHLFMDAKQQLPFQSIFRYLLHCWNLWELLKSEVKPMGQVSLQMSPARKGCLPTSAVHGWSVAKPLQGFLSTRKGTEKGLEYLLLGYIYIYVHTHMYIHMYEVDLPPAARFRHSAAALDPSLPSCWHWDIRVPACHWAPVLL